MKLRERLLLLLTPLVTLPLFFAVLFCFFYIEKIAPGYFQNFSFFAFLFMASLTILVMAMLVSISNSIVKPIQEVIENAKQVSQGNFDHPIHIQKSDAELDQLVTVIKEMKKALKQQKVTIEETAKQNALGKMVAQIAHDIRSPLAAIQSSLFYFQAQSSSSQEFQESVELLRLGSNRLVGMAEDLVQKYREGHRQHELFSIHQSLDHLIREFSLQKKYGGITFDRKYHQKDIVLRQNQLSIERVFSNLIKNAVEAIGIEGKITIKTFSEADHSVIEIEDDGCGIEKAKLPLIFNDLYTSGKENGTGIGLAFVKKTIENACGSISVRSKLGQGTTFCIRFPVSQRPHDEAQEIWQEKKMLFEVADQGKTIH